jgi:V8-like Glu-specific endopeptidase
MVYQKLVSSVVLIRTPADSIGSGALIDAKQRLVVTAGHVPGSSDTVDVWFVQRDQNGRPINDISAYFGGSVKPIKAKVVERLPRCDLALIELDSVPLGAAELPLSIKGAMPGQTVHVVGHSNIKRGAVFGYSSGQVRNTYGKRATADNPLAGRVLESSIPTNKGDSGGPVVNDRGELVAIVSLGTTGADNVRSAFYQEQVVDLSIDVAEVRGLLLSHAFDATARLRQQPANPDRFGVLGSRNPVSPVRLTSSLFNPNGSLSGTHSPLWQGIKETPHVLTGGCWFCPGKGKGGSPIRFELTILGDGTFRMVEVAADGVIIDSTRGSYSFQNGRLILRDKQQELSGLVTWDGADRFAYDLGNGKLSFTRQSGSGSNNR